MKQPTLFDSSRATLADAMELTAQSLNAYGADYEHWAIAYSGGKDSSATLAATIYLIESGRVSRPKSLTVLLSDTRMELPPLFDSAMKVMSEVRARGFKTEGLSIVKSIQYRAGVDLINHEEESRINELIEAKTWPRGWDGTEPLASVPFDNVNPDGSIQPRLFYET